MNFLLQRKQESEVYVTPEEVLDQREDTRVIRRII